MERQPARQTDRQTDRRMDGGADVRNDDNTRRRRKMPGVVTNNFLLSRWSTRITWWRHQMETFSALLALCAGNSPVTGEFPSQRPVTESFDVFFDLRLNERLSKQAWGRWFETPSCSLWRHSNAKNGMETSVYSDYIYDFPATKTNKLEPYRDLSWYTFISINSDYSCCLGELIT